MILEIKDNKIIAQCPMCNQTFTMCIETVDNAFSMVMKSFAENAECDDCGAKRIATINAEEQQYRDAKIAYELLEDSNLPEKFLGLGKPIVSFAASWIHDHKNFNLLISGESGAGKTSSAVYVAERCIKFSKQKVRYYATFADLNAEYISAKTGNSDTRKTRESQFWSKLHSYDLLIIDEQVGQGEQVRLTPSGQELLFQLINSVYDGTHRGRVWILGNFFKGAIDRMTGTDAVPLKRRITESFLIGVIKENSVVEIEHL